jgi:hypothetical protein
MTRFTSDINRNLLYALSALPPAIFLVTGHVLLGVLFLACVVGGRLSRPKPSRRSRRPARRRAV